MSPRNTRERSGFALIVVLLVVVLLELLLLQLGVECRVNMDAAANWRAAQQALCCAEAGLSAAAGLVTHPEAPPTAETLRDAFAKELEVGGGTCTVKIAQHNGRLNVRSLTDQKGRLSRPRADQLLGLIDLLNVERTGEKLISYRLVPSLADWLDADDDVTVLPFVQRENEGAEDDYYNELDPPYDCKNGPPDALDELQLVRGVTRDAFAPPAEDEQDAGSGLREFLTIYGSDKVDVNYAPPTVLAALSERVSLEAARVIVDARFEGPFENIEDLGAVGGLSKEAFDALRPHLTARAEVPYFEVTATGQAHGATRTLRSVFRVESGRAIEILREEL